jgi:acid phosphatase (class A)
MAAAIALLGSLGSAQSSGPRGYLGKDDFDVTAVIERAPVPGDPRYKSDREIFRKTRKLVGSARYAMAIADAQTRPAAMLKDFSCAMGVGLTPANAPRLAALAQRAGFDTGVRAGAAKNVYQRQRPYVIDKGPTCQSPAELLDPDRKRASYDYPSGHSTWGWTWALVLASAAPDRAQQILERGRAYSESRFVCGVHNQSAVEAGMLAASATMAVIQTKPAYQMDLAAARQEVAIIRRDSSATPAHCEAEARLVAQPVLPPLADPVPARF